MQIVTCEGTATLDASETILIHSSLMLMQTVLTRKRPTSAGRERKDIDAALTRLCDLIDAVEKELP